MPSFARQAKSSTIHHRHFGEAVVLVSPLGVDAAGHGVEPLGMALRLLVDHHQAILVRKRQGLEKHAANDREERDVSADAEGHDDDGDGGEAGGAAKGADAITNVVEERFEAVPAPCGAGLLAKQGWIAEGAEGGEAGFFRGHAGGDVFGDLAIDVEAEFFIEGRCCRGAPEEHPYSHLQL